MKKNSSIPFCIFSGGYRRMFWNQRNFRRQKLKKIPGLCWFVVLRTGNECASNLNAWDHFPSVVPWLYFFCSAWKIRRYDLFFANSLCTEHDCEKQDWPLFLWFLENGVDSRHCAARPRRCVLLTPLFAQRENNMVGFFRLYPYMLSSCSFYSIWSNRE